MSSDATSRATTTDLAVPGPAPSRATTDLLCELPDLPRWVEARGMLLSGRGRVAWRSDRSPAAAILVQDDIGLVAVVGRPPAGQLRAAAAAARELVAPLEGADRIADVLPAWRSEVAHLHVLARRPAGGARGADVRLLAPGALDRARHLPDTLLAELETELAAGTEVAAAIVDGRAVSFCYAGAVTERLWDVSVDTLEGFRRRGLARACARWMIARQAERGRAPVWGAVASNVASLGLARALGFVRTDALLVFGASSET